MKKRLISIFTIFVILLFPARIIFGASEAENLMQMAILLDTSNSMDGLIEQAKSQLWKIVNELALGKRTEKALIYMWRSMNMGKLPFLQVKGI